jgi:hypothetical protein
MDEKWFCGPEAVRGPQIGKDRLPSELYITNLQHHVTRLSVLRISTVSYHEREVNNGGIRRQKIRALKTSAHKSRTGLTLGHKEMNSTHHCDYFTKLHLIPSTYVPDSSFTLHCTHRFLTNPSPLIAHDNPHTSSDANLPSHLLPKAQMLKYISKYSIIFDFFHRPLWNYNTTFRKQSHFPKHSVRDIQQTMEKVPKNRRNST